MALTALPTATSLTSLGIAVGPTFGVALDAVNGNSFTNDGKKYLFVYNGSGGSITVTFTAFPTGAAGTKPDGLAITNQIVTIPTLTSKLIGPFKQAIYNDGSGLVELLSSVGPLVLGLVLDATPNP